MKSYFNVRVYGVLINSKAEVLLSDESFETRKFTKFPGGGVELGEGLSDALKREFMEECNLEIDILRHLYTTDFYEKSSFNESQIISVYYLIQTQKELNLAIINTIDPKQHFRWKSLETLQEQDVTFKTDQVVVSILKSLN